MPFHFDHDSEFALEQKANPQLPLPTERNYLMIVMYDHFYLQMLLL